MKPGIYTDITNEQYHSSEGISRSGIMAFRKSPMHYWHDYINPDRSARESTQAMIFGNAVHTFILEPKEFLNRYKVIDKVDRRTKEGKEYWLSLSEFLGKKSFIDDDTLKELTSIKNSILNNSEASELIANAKYENSIYWKDEETDVICKARPDAMRENAIIDLKTTDDASPKAFARSCYNYGYHIQAAMISDGIKYNTGQLINHFIYVVVEKNPPYANAIYVLDESAIEIGRETYKKSLYKYKECLDSGNWPGYETQTISLPNYASYENE